MGDAFIVLYSTNCLSAIARATNPPVIAAVRGFALGGGLELALACDLRVAADSARLGQPEILLGIIPGAGGTQRLPRLVGPARAKELVWSGRQVRADEALAIGLVDRVVPAEEVLDAAVAYAQDLAANCSPTSMAIIKSQVQRHLEVDLDTALADSEQLMKGTFERPDMAEGVQSYLQKRPPAFPPLAPAGADA